MKIDKKLISQGYISERKHPECDYFIYNYTSKTQYEQNWNAQTMNCRGLILDGDGNIIAKPFSKFFNIGEYSQHNNLGKIPNWKYFDVFDKMDGSLGILYKLPNGDYKIATRGSFESEQAKVGTIIWESRNIYNNFLPDDDYTYLFEIIYPENRIVIDYGDKKDLILLAVIHKETGEELGYEELLKLAEDIGCPMTQYYGRIAYNRHAFQKIGADIPEGHEGFVMRFDNGLRVKIKAEEYVRLHRLITGVSNKSIWDLLRHGENIDELLDRVPDEFYDWVEQTKRDFENNYESIEHSCKVIIDSAVFETRKEVAEYLLQKEHKIYSGILFAMYDNKPYDQAIWRLLKPEYSKPFKKDV